MSPGSLHSLMFSRLVAKNCEELTHLRIVEIKMLLYCVMWVRYLDIYQVAEGAPSLLPLLHAWCRLLCHQQPSPCQVSGSQVGGVPASSCPPPARSNSGCLVGASLQAAVPPPARYISGCLVGLLCQQLFLPLLGLTVETWWGSLCQQLSLPLQDISVDA